MALKPLLRAAHAALVPLLPAEARLALEGVYFRLCGEAELRLVGRLCRPDQDALDVGGNQGCYSLFMRGAARRVHCFEPVPWMADGLARKFGRSIVLHRVALSSTTGIAELVIPEVDGRRVTALASLSPPTHLTGAAITVPTARLDEVYAGQAGFIKIDVEGHEQAVLDGAAATIARCRPRLMIEIEERYAPDGRRRIAADLAARGYRGFFLLEGRLRPIDGFDPAWLQQPGLRPYVNNFIFLPGEDVAAVMTGLGLSS